MQGYLQCTKMLYGFGYRIDESKSVQEKNTPKEEPDGREGVEEGEKLNTNTGNKERLPGKEEWIRQKNVIDSPYPDQVKFHRG